MPIASRSSGAGRGSRGAGWDGPCSRCSPRAAAARRLTALPGGQLTASGADAPWRASFAWDGDPAAVESAELELGRRLVVELPRPRRRRRRTSDSVLGPSTAAAAAAAAPAPAGDDVRAQLAELRSQMQDLRRERDAAAAPLAELREQHGALEDDHAAAEREADDLRDERDAAHAELGRLREALASTQAPARRRPRRDRLGRLAARAAPARSSSRPARRRSRSATELEQTRAALESTRAELARAHGDVAERDRGVEAAVAALEVARREHEEALAEVRADAVRRVDAERESSAGLREKLASAREDAERAKREAAAAIEAEARETEKLRLEARSTRDEAEQTVAGERAEAARLREELAGREPRLQRRGRGHGRAPHARPRQPRPRARARGVAHAAPRDRHACAARPRSIAGWPLLRPRPA